MAGQLERLSPFPRDGKAHLIGKELPVPWSWQGARCLPGLVHVEIHCLAFNSLLHQLLELLMTVCSQNNTRGCFFQLRSAESRYLPISTGGHQALVIPGSPMPECDPTGRFPRHLERTPDLPCQLIGLLTASFQRAWPVLPLPAEQGCDLGQRQPSECPRPSETGKIFLEAGVLTWSERELAFGSQRCNRLGLPFFFCVQKERKSWGEVYLLCILLRAKLKMFRLSFV